MDPDIAARLDHAQLGYPCPAIWIWDEKLDLSTEELDEFGFVSMRAVERGQPFPEATGLAVDLRFDRRIALLSTEPPFATLFECAFADSHRDRWADDGHAQGRMLVFIGPDRSIRSAAITHWLGDAQVAVVPLAVFTFAWGVGTRA
jgi:hypothetical protein